MIFILCISVIQSDSVVVGSCAGY